MSITSSLIPVLKGRLEAACMKCIADIHERRQKAWQEAIDNAMNMERKIFWFFKLPNFTEDEAIEWLKKPHDMWYSDYDRIQQQNHSILYLATVLKQSTSLTSDGVIYLSRDDFDNLRSYF